MDKFNLKYYDTKSLITIIVFLGLGIGLLASWLKLQGYFISFSTVGVISGFLLFIDKYWWKLEIKGYRLFKFLIPIPNLNGRYEGVIRFVHPYENIEMEKQCVIEIVQTGSKIKINSYLKKNDDTERTISKSLVESLIKNDDEFYDIVFTYQNDGLINDGRFRPHYGTNILKVIETNNSLTLKGKYYTDRHPQTKGELDVKFISKKLKRDF